jgi:alkylated DNA repair protein (DNA oxidative demethylase)
MACVEEIIDAAPLRHMQTLGGKRMSVAMTNCGRFGWVTDRRGYRYQADDPSTGSPWPEIPALFADLARTAAASVGFERFEPDACLINCYEPGARMALHQDRDERDFSQPIVSVSLGLPAIFQFGGLRRAERPQRIQLHHGDVLVWGGPARLRFHGVLPIQPALYGAPGIPRALGARALDSRRINLTFRKTD